MRDGMAFPLIDWVPEACAAAPSAGLRAVEDTFAVQQALTHPKIGAQKVKGRYRRTVFNRFLIACNR